MMRALLKPWASLWASLTAQPAPLRVGVLNTGELALVGGDGHALVLSAQTTELIRDQLWLADSGPPGSKRCCHHAVLGDHDDVYHVLSEARK